MFDFLYQYFFFVASNGIVLATENKHKSILYEEHSVSKVEMISSHIGMVYSGMFIFIKEFFTNQLFYNKNKMITFLYS